MSHESAYNPGKGLTEQWVPTNLTQRRTISLKVTTLEEREGECDFDKGRPELMYRKMHLFTTTISVAASPKSCKVGREDLRLISHLRYLFSCIPDSKQRKS